MKGELDSAVEVFVQAIAKIRNVYRPHICNRLESLYVLRDPPGQRNPRKTEIVALDQDPPCVVRLIREAGIGWHYLSDLRKDGSDFFEVRNRYKTLGYRALTTEWMFIHDLETVPKFYSDPSPRIVQSQELADTIPYLARQKIKVVPNTRDFVVWDEHRQYGRVRSINIGSDCWVQGLYVYPDVRRRGYGKALMAALLESDREVGKRNSVLLASSAGAMVYPALGYRQIGVLQLFSPIRESI